MSLSLKIDLENRIFARAAFLHMHIEESSGTWRASSEKDAYLNALLRVYNQFFSCPSDTEDRSDWQNFWSEYERQRPFAGGVKNGWILPLVSVNEKKKY